MIVPHITKRQLATILAALRLWQDGSAIGDDGDPYLADIATNGGKFEPLNNSEIDILCERLNSGEKL